MSKYDLSTLDLSRLFGGKHFLVSTILCSKGYGVSLNSLVDTGAQGYLFLNSSIATAISKSLQVPIRKLPYKVLIRGFKDQISTPSTQYIRLHMKIDGRKIFNCPFIIVDLGSQDCIIGIRWLKRFKLQLDTDRNRLCWPLKYPAQYDPSPPLLMTLHQPNLHKAAELDIKRRDALWEKEQYREQQSPGSILRRIRGMIRLPKSRCLSEHQRCPVKVPKAPRIKPLSERQFTISCISANAFHFVMKKPKNEFFITSLYEIDRIQQEKRDLQPDNPENAALVAERLPARYQAYRDVFSQTAADKLPEHRPYDHKIILTEPLPNQ